MPDLNRDVRDICTFAPGKMLEESNSESRLKKINVLIFTKTVASYAAEKSRLISL